MPIKKGGKSPSGGLGKSLVRAKQERQRGGKGHKMPAMLPNELPEDSEVRVTAPLKSIWETSNLDEFLHVAEQRENGFAAERNVRVVVNGTAHVLQNDKIVPDPNADERVSNDWLLLSEKHLTIPKRPSWSYEDDPAIIQRNEEIAFLKWRRSLVQAEESTKIVLTPYEKNLEVWRQLWRVVERSDIILEIVDARNPLLFRSADFEKYVETFVNAHGCKKRWYLLANKADLLSDAQRKAWSEYFESRGVPCFFFSAKAAVAEQKVEVEPDATDLHGDESDDEDEVIPDEDVEQVEEAAVEVAQAKHQKRGDRSRKLKGSPVYRDPHVPREVAPPKPDKKADPETKMEAERNVRLTELKPLEPWSVLSPVELLDRLAFLRDAMRVEQDEPLMVGMVGYPNVGKSSTINAIIGCKRVVVSATPGKTKHFQTLPIPGERRVMLCDSPGLVFPSFATTREAMVVDGILPVDTLKNYVAAVTVVCRRIPRAVLEARYTIKLDPTQDVDDSSSLADFLLNTLARRRGCMSDHNKPNKAFPAREILKDYVDGELVFVAPPPGMTLESLGAEGAVAAPSHPAPAAEEEASDEEGEDWEDISSADEARNLSDRDDSEAEGAEKAPPVVETKFFMGRGKELSVAERFNTQNVELGCPQVTKRRRRRGKVNHQLVEDIGVVVTNGVTEVLIDTDDDIEEFASKPEQDHKLSKKAMRRNMRKEGLHLPPSHKGHGAVAVTF